MITQQLDVLNVTKKEELQEVYIESVMQKLIAELNDKEWQLRDYFYQLKGRIKMRGYHPTFYLPESLMLMNQTAHRKMLEKLRSEAVSADASGDGQSRESMAAFDMGDWRNVVFRSDFTVVKPNKKIGGNEYLHNLRALIQVGFTSEVLCSTLKNVRQSAFNHNDWRFVSGSDKVWDIAKGYPSAPAEGNLSLSQAQNGLNAKRSELAMQMYDNVKDDISKACSISDKK